MKKVALFMIASVALVAASCSGSAEGAEEAVVETVTYSLDAENSTLEWAASMSPEYGHYGTVDVTEGSLTMEGDAVTAGSFTVDMTSIKSTDLEAPKASYLEGHLMGTMPDEDHPEDLFFNTPKYPNAEVKVNGYEDGKLNITLMMLGKELTQDVDVDVMSDENGAAIKGDFSLDMTSLEIPGLQPNPEDGSGINPVLDFTINLSLKK